MLLAEGAQTAVSVVVLIGMLVVGILSGLWPLEAGSRTGRPGLGALGLCVCVSVVFLGCLFAPPTALFFRVLIALLGHPAPPPGGAEGLGGEAYNPYANGKRPPL
jgi:hypothetical protein